MKCCAVVARSTAGHQPGSAALLDLEQPLRAAYAHSSWVTQSSSVVSFFFLARTYLRTSNCLCSSAQCLWLVVNSLLFAPLAISLRFRAAAENPLGSSQPGGVQPMGVQTDWRCSCSFHSAIFFPYFIGFCFTTSLQDDRNSN